MANDTLSRLSDFKALLCKSEVLIENDHFSFGVGGQAALLPCWGNLTYLALTFGTWTETNNILEPIIQPLEVFPGEGG